MKFFIAIAVGLLILSACQQPIEIKVSDDPRIFSGHWQGNATEYLGMEVGPVNKRKGWVAVTTNRKELLILNTATGTQESRIEDYTAVPLGFAADGSFLVEFLRPLNNSSFTVQVRSTQTWEIVRSFEVGQGVLQLSQDGNWLFDGVGVFRVADGNLVRQFSVQAYQSLLSATGKYLLEVKYTQAQPELKLWDVASGASKTLQWPLPLTQTTPPPPPVDVRNLIFSADDGRLVLLTYNQNHSARVLVVWGIESGNIQSRINLPLTVTRLSWLAPDGLSGSAFQQTYQGSTWQVAEVFWNQQGIQRTQDITALLKGQVSSFDLKTLTPSEAYLTLLGEFPPEGNRGLGYGTIYRSLAVARLGSLPWEFKRQPEVFALSFVMQAQRQDDGTVNLMGTAKLADKDYTVSGKGRGGGVKFMSNVVVACGSGQVGSQCAPPPQIWAELELMDNAGNIRYISLNQLIHRNTSTEPPSYDGWYASARNLWGGWDTTHAVNLKRP